MKLLILGHTIPEPTTTAAGSRMLQIISVFQEEGYSIYFATSAQKNPRSIDLETIGVELNEIKLNDSSFDQFIVELNPKIVLYDRFVIEEQYGWRVAKNCPNALRILDTEDLHFLRKARQQSIKKNGNLIGVDLYTDLAKREIASIYRCDLSLIISSYEINLLTSSFGLNPSILHYLPFVVEEQGDEETMSFEERSNFITIGNFFHAPNVDSVLFLKREIWPLIRNKLPKAKLLVYGNYAPQQINELHNEAEGFLIKGWAPSINRVMSSAKVCLVPLRFGAGLKGKLLDAMKYGTPAVTSQVGAEGMYGSYTSYFSTEMITDFVDRSVQLYVDSNKWIECQQMGFDILKENYNKSIIAPQFVLKIKSLLSNLEDHRKDNFIGQILRHQSMQSTRYMSMWIEEKNRDKT